MFICIYMFNISDKLFTKKGYLIYIEIENENGQRNFEKNKNKIKHFHAKLRELKSSEIKWKTKRK